MKKHVSLLLVFLICFVAFSGCSSTNPVSEPPVVLPSSSSTSSRAEISSQTLSSSATSITTAATNKVTQSTSHGTASAPTLTTTNSKVLLNGIPLSKYTIVYDGAALDYTETAAKYIHSQIHERTGIDLNITEISKTSKAFAHEIVVGETSRRISRELDVNTKNLEFALMARDGHIALEGKYFVIAAAAYYFVETYITSKEFSNSVPATETVCQPITEKASNYILLIGDGMGVFQTQLFESMSASAFTNYSDKEDVFYGYLLPYSGYARTDSLSGITDSAAGGTALASGFKTNNGYIGRDKNLSDVLSITEIAGQLNMATAIMSTEEINGATPAAFSSHANNRGDTMDILVSQKALSDKYNTTLLSFAQFNSFDTANVWAIENTVRDTLHTLSKNKNGFFLMYEEAYIDKYCHSMDIKNTFRALVRFNQIIATFMEYAFYHPNTFLLITADHETGGLTKDKDGNFSYTNGNHTRQNVPIFAYGNEAKLFHRKTIENTQIPKTIAALWNWEIIGNEPDKPSLK